VSDDRAERPGARVLAEETFPCAVLAGAETAACFFAAAFHGRQDVIHVLDAGVREITVIDKDWPKLLAMAALYPKDTLRLRHGDALLEAKHLIGRGDAFDVVTLDPWTQFIPATLSSFTTYARLARRALVAGVSAEWLADAPPTPEGVLKRLWLEIGEEPLVAVPCVEVRKRSDHLGGIYWAVFSRGAR
jgi:hypothetical protein